MKNKLRKYILDNGFLTDGSCLYSRFKLPDDLHEYLMIVTSYFIEEVRYTDRLLAFLNGQTELNHCLVCNKPIYPKPNNPQLYCGKKCAGISERTKERRVGTNISLYGVGNTYQSKDKKDKIIRTNLERYGVENPQQSEMIRNKAEETNLKRYGVRCVTEANWFREKAQSTFFEKYGVNNPSQTSLSEEHKSLLNDSDLLNKLHIHDKKTVLQIADELGLSHATLLRYFKKHNIHVRHSCTVSLPEIKLVQFISSIYEEDIRISVRDILPNIELDIYIPKHKIAIEYNGLYWHSESKGKDKNYHINKTELCEKEGIQLLQIWSTDSPEIWKSVIASKLGVFEQKIGARKCTVKDVNFNDTREFLIANHLQGSINSSINKGLFYRDELVALATFSRPRFRTFKGLELLRFCNKRNVQIIGGCSKLLKSVDSPILSYANRRWSDGKLYKSTGFVLHSIAPPNYFYTKDYIHLHSRIQFQKHKLMDKLEIYDPTLSESENMWKNGYDRIWDCGNLTYTRE